MSLEVHDLGVKKCFTLWDAIFDQEKVEIIASKDLTASTIMILS